MGPSQNTVHARVILDERESDDDGDGDDEVSIILTVSLTHSLTQWGSSVR
jgi:hypothetical protein